MSHAIYQGISEYIFDDNDTYPFRVELGPKWFDAQTAESIIRHFLGYKDSVEALLVHCALGKNRSPAVALALNDIFNLGHDPETLKRRYPAYNRFVYETMISAGKRHPIQEQ